MNKCKHCGVKIIYAGGNLWHEIGPRIFPQYCTTDAGCLDQLHEPDMTTLSNERLDMLALEGREEVTQYAWLQLIAQARRANDLLSRQPVTLESGEVVQLVPVEPSFQMLPAATQADEYDAPLTAHLVKE